MAPKIKATQQDREAMQDLIAEHLGIPQEMRRPFFDSFAGIQGAIEYICGTDLHYSKRIQEFIDGSTQQFDGSDTTLLGRTIMMARRLWPEYIDRIRWNALKDYVEALDEREMALSRELLSKVH